MWNWLTKRYFWWRRLDLVALPEEAPGGQPRTARGSTPTLSIAMGRTSLSNHPTQSQPPADGWQWMLTLAKPYGPQPIPAMPPPMVQLPSLTVSSLLDQHIQQGQCTPWKPPLEESFGHTTLEPLCMEAPRWVADAFMLGVDTVSTLEHRFHSQVELHSLPSVSHEPTHFSAVNLLTIYPWINMQLIWYISVEK